MLGKIFLIVLLLSVPVLVSAETVHLQWDANSEPSVIGYRVYMGTQIDLTTWNWEQVGDVDVPDFVYDVPADELRLFRCSAYDLAGNESLRYDAGVFFCSGWNPPDKPVGARIE